MVAPALRVRLPSRPGAPLPRSSSRQEESSDACSCSLLSPFGGGPRKTIPCGGRGVRQQFSEEAEAGGGAAYARRVRSGGRLRLGLAAIALGIAVWGSLQLA